jgi:hypothetical protein
MHWNTEQVLWALVFAAHLVLLVVLLGRDRISRFPWFTTVIALSAVRLLADHLLFGQLTTMAFYWQTYGGTAIDSILGIVVLVELARRIFSSSRTGSSLTARNYGTGALLTSVIAGLIVYFWGRPWLTWQQLQSQKAELAILLLALSAMKLQLFVAILTVEVNLLFQVFGKRHGSGWKSHARQIALGLSTNALGLLAVQGITDYIKRTVKLTSREQYDKILHMFGNLDHARFALWLVVLIWWIIWLWREEPVPAGAVALVEDTSAIVEGESVLDGEAAADSPEQYLKED